MSEKDEGSALPGGGTEASTSGLTLRDFFAGIAMHAHVTRGYREINDLAREVYKVADGMVRESRVRRGEDDDG